MDESLAQTQTALAERTALLQAQLEAAVAQRDSIAAERDAVLAERDAMVAERDAVAAERDRLRRAYERLKQQYFLLKHRLYVAKAERIDARQLELDFAQTKAQLDELARQLGEQAPDPEQPPPKRKPKGRRKLAARTDMPEQRLEILDPVLEGNAERIGFQESWYIGYRRGGPVRIVVARAKYKLDEDGKTKLCTAQKPKMLLRRGLVAPSLIARILTGKYCFGLPFHRQVSMLAAEGVELDDGTMCRYAEHIGASLGPIVEASAKEAKESAFCLATDATGVAIQPVKSDKPRSRSPCSRGHFFVVLADQDHIFFEYRPKQNSAVVCEMFQGFSGYIQADAHSIFNALFRGDGRSDPEENPPLEVGCWSHCRTKFWEAATATKDLVALEALLRIRKLFQLEEHWKKLSPKRRLQKRQHVAKPLVDAFFEWVKARHEENKHVRGLLRSACGYAVRQETVLRRYLENGRLEMTNNRSERALRTIAVGRKAWLFCGSDDHASAAANLLSLIAGCKLHDLDPEQYLAEVVHVMPYWPPERYLELAPKYWRATRDRLDPAQLARELGPITVPAAEKQPSTD